MSLKRNVSGKQNGEKISRRSFLSSIVTLWGVILSLPFIYGVVEYLTPPIRKTFGVKSIWLTDLHENSSKLLIIDDEPIILIRKTGNDITALSAKCTHLDCIVGYRENEKDIICNCHDSTFNLEGVPLQGPAKEPLLKYKVTIDKDKIIISNPV